MAVSRSHLSAAALAAACLAGAAGAALQPVPFTSVHLTDAFWAPRVRRNAAVTLPYELGVLESTGRIRNFQRAAGKLSGAYEGLLFNDSDVYKVLEGAAYTLAQKRDPALEKRCDELIGIIAAAQQPDGYLDTYYTVNGKLDKRHTNEAWDHETYCAGHLIEAGVAYFQATGKRPLLDVAIRLADYYDGVYGPGKKHDATGHEEIELALVKLFRLTGEKRYLRLASFLVEQRGRPEGGRALQGEYSQDNIPVRDQREIVGHAVRAMYLFCAVTDLAGETGDKGYLRAADSVWRDVNAHKMYVTGGIGPSGSNEGFTTAYDLPNDSAYAETCAAIALALWNQRMAIQHADARYADVVERAMYNGLLSGISLSGDRFNYVNPLGTRGGHHRQPWFDCACCPTNIVRYIPTVAGNVYATGPRDLYVNQYIANESRFPIAGVPASVAMRTRYPWDGDVSLAVSPERPTKFAVRLRVPGWCQGRQSDSDLYTVRNKPASGAVRLWVNGRAVPAFSISKGYAVVSRVWRKGDVVRWSMPMAVRRVVSHPKVTPNAGRVALQRGPVVYCLEDVDNPSGARRIAIPSSATIRSAYLKNVLGGVQVLVGTGVARTLDGPATSGFTAVPYFAWNNRDDGGMRLWVPESADGADAPVQPTLASEAKVSWSFRQGDRRAPNDQVEPASSADPEAPHFTWWNHFGTTEWLQYEWDQPVDASGVEVYWFDDRPGGGCRVPKEWHVEYRDGDAFRPVEDASGYTVDPDRYNRAAFRPVRTTALRLVVTSDEGVSSGVLEWRVLPAENRNP